MSAPAQIAAERGGLSAAGLERLRAILGGHVERGAAPGLVSLVSRRGETHIEVIGTTAVGGSAPMRRDTIFRLSSITKPVTAAAAMILVEECVLRLDEPVDALLPELADRRVLRTLQSGLDDTVPAMRPITMRDLLTFRVDGHHPPHPGRVYVAQPARARARFLDGGLRRHR